MEGTPAVPIGLTDGSGSGGFALGPSLQWLRRHALGLHPVAEPVVPLWPEVGGGSMLAFARS